jgi:hypothetical protein
MAKDEGHGFAKRSNQDFQFIAMTMFWQQFLLPTGEGGRRPDEGRASRE